MRQSARARIQCAQHIYRVGGNTMNRLKRLVVYGAAALFLLAPSPSPANGSQVYFNDFDGGLTVAPGVTGTLGGITSTESVQGYAGLGTGSNTFGGDFLRNTTGGYASIGGQIGTPGSPTTLTLSGLPPHTSIDLNFLLAIIDSWDGSDPGGCTICHPDILTIAVDGNTAFSESFGFNGPTFVPPPGVLLTEFIPLGFNPDFGDAAYDMGLNLTFDDIPHSANSLIIEWVASGEGWQGGDDESWALDNVEVVLHGQSVALDIKPQSCPNPLNTKKQGVTPVAILGANDLDVTQIDVDSIRLEGVVPVRSAIEDIGTPFEPFIGKEDASDCNDYGPDGFDDLNLKFGTRELVDALGDVEDGEQRILTLTGALWDGTPIQGEDVIVILQKGGH